MRFTLLSKILLICFIPLLGFLMKAGTLVVDRLATQTSADQLLVNVGFIQELSNVLDLIQEERFLATIVSNDETPEKDLAQHQTKVDEALGELIKKSESAYIGEDYSTKLNQSFTQFKGNRFAADSDVEIETVFAGYRGIIETLLDGYNRLSHSSSVPGVSSKLTTISMLALANENGSRLRDRFYTVLVSDQPFFAETKDP